MKKIALILALCFSIIGIAQEKQIKKREQQEKLSLDQKSQLRLKKMTLDFSLNENQQKEISKLILDDVSKKQALRDDLNTRHATNKPLTANEKFSFENKKLDNEIDFKTKLKKVLNEEQFKKWEASQEKMKSIMKHRKNKSKKTPVLEKTE